MKCNHTPKNLHVHIHQQTFYKFSEIFILFFQKGGRFCGGKEIYKWYRVILFNALTSPGGKYLWNWVDHISTSSLSKTVLRIAQLTFRDFVSFKCLRLAIRLSKEAGKKFFFLPSYANGKQRQESNWRCLPFSHLCKYF